MFSFFYFLIGISIGAKEFIHDKKPFRLEYDESVWEISPSHPKHMGSPREIDKWLSKPTLLSLQRKEKDDNYHSRFSIVVDKFESDTAKSNVELLQVAADRSIKFLKDQRFSIRLKEPSHPLNTNLLSYRIIGEQRDFGLTFHQFILIHGEEVYYLTHAARTSQFEKQKDEGEKLIQSFKLGTFQSSTH